MTFYYGELVYWHSTEWHRGTFRGTVYGDRAVVFNACVECRGRFGKPSKEVEYVPLVELMSEEDYKRLPLAS